MQRFPVLFFLFLLSSSGSAQSYQFFNFGLSEGLCDKFAYTINQDQQGFLWIGTTQGLCRFDGKVFEQEFKGDSIPESIAFSSLLDSRGRLWFGHENGLLSVLEEGEFRLISPSDDFRSAVKAIREDDQGNILVLCQQSGLLVISPDLEIIYTSDQADPSDPFSGKFLNNFQLTADGNLLVGTNDGLSIFRYDEDLETYIQTGDIADFQYLLVQEIVPAVNENEFWVGTEDEGLFRITGEGYNPVNYTVEKIGVDKGLAYARISSIVFDGNRRVWVTDYGVGLHRFELDENGNLEGSIFFNVEAGIPNEYINQIFIDEEGNQWFSSSGNGIAVLRDQAFTFYDLWEDEQFSDVSAVYFKGDEYWFGGHSRIARMVSWAPEEVAFLGKENGLPEDKVTALYMDPNNDLYIGTEGSGLYIKRDGSPRIRPLAVSRNSLENNINAIDGNSDSVFIATNNGVYTINPANGNRTSFTTANGLPHNKINDILVDREGVAWIATITSGLHGIKSEKEIIQIILTGKPKMEFLTLAEDDNGVIWAGTDGDGVYRFNDDRLGWYGADKGLLNDFAYAIGIDPGGYIWVGHRMGLSRIHPETGTIRMYGKESGFTSDIIRNAVATADDGKMFLGTTGGIILYDAYQAREDTVAPRLSLKSVVISDQSYDPLSEIKLKYDKYRIRIDFVGINLSNPEQVTYQFKLDGYEEEWSDVSHVPYAFYGRVEDGDYTFMLRACDGNGNCSSEPLTLHISVKIPIWKAWWFILSAVMLVLATIFIIFKIRERNQKAIQEYLQRQLDERTREVILQKEEIEIKNRDITDSINYAQRIQASILPPIKKLHDTFSGSFVFYQPRDIVSGDFYWYEEVVENKFIVVCADSTGHGVPGAFMSMIGTTLIKDICVRAGIRKPSQILTTLDNEVREALNQNMETTGSNDGMDIIVAEVDMKTYKFTVSSAMRPVIIYSGEEQIYVKGSRSSVGGQLDEDRLEKDFIDQEFQLKKGDIIYMFSDGYPDQFGGPLGRKFKMVRLKNLLRDIHDKPMDEQYNYIKSNFFLWKEDLEQVDDVLFMGIKL
ncbi:MAG: SpoIIE family protein phosphatase [Bacteroidales bacterium]|nr:SpoIIE family protein phosphatase [Bacteroidales bacterium]